MSANVGLWEGRTYELPSRIGRFIPVPAVLTAVSSLVHERLVSGSRGINPQWLQWAHSRNCFDVLTGPKAERHPRGQTLNDP